MAIIAGIRIKNYRALKDVTLGRLWNLQGKMQLSPVTAVIGKNGAGKSTLFDVFGFLSDCLKVGVEDACDACGRGGYERLISKGQTGAIEFELYYKEDLNARPITYELAIDLDQKHRPYVSKERLRQRRKGQSHGRPFSFLHLENGRGIVWKGDNVGHQDNEKENIQDIINNREESNETELVELGDVRKLGIATLGALKQHPRIQAFKDFIEGWYLSYFSPDAARGLPLSGPQKHLSVHGDNLANVVQYMERNYSKRFQTILNMIAEKIPGLESIKTNKTPDGRLLLEFNDSGFKDPFYAQQMSDGTLKLFTYMLMLEDPTPPPFLCIEEPENGLYHKLLEVLAGELRDHANGRKKGSQIFITTHQPYFINALKPEEVWILEKETDGFSRARRASDDPLIVNMTNEGVALGDLWYSDYLDNQQV